MRLVMPKLLEGAIQFATMEFVSGLLKSTKRHAQQLHSLARALFKVNLVSVIFVKMRNSCVPIFLLEQSIAHQ
jgi:hypothetical protein